MIGVIEQSITPLAGKLGQQKYVIAIRDGFTAALPFMIIGSFMLVLFSRRSHPETTNSFARAWLDFSTEYRAQLMLPFNLSMGVMTFFISVGIASLGRQFNLDPVMTGLLAFMAFLLVAAPYHEGQIPPSTSPARDLHRAADSDLLRARLCLASSTTSPFACRKRCRPVLPARLKSDPGSGDYRYAAPAEPVYRSANRHDPAAGDYAPAGTAGLRIGLTACHSAFCTAVPDLLVCRYPRFADCHRHHEPVLDGQPLRQPGCTGAGAALPHVYLQGFWDHYLLIGGGAQPYRWPSCCCVAALRTCAPSAKWAWCRFFNINEPILFGAPIIMNPMLFIPFVCVPLVNAFWRMRQPLGLLAQVVR
jgi:PTS system cellobiose-specific IIC component